MLQTRGREHEAAYIEHLRSKGLQICENPSSIDATIDAMEAGYDVIKQAHLGNASWQGYADVLRKVAKPGRFGDWSYEIVDTKLARETRAGTILQLCLYCELLDDIQKVLPDEMHVVSPGRDFEPESFRVHDYLDTTGS